MLVPCTLPDEVALLELVVVLVVELYVVVTGSMGVAVAPRATARTTMGSPKLSMVYILWASCRGRMGDAELGVGVTLKRY